MKLSPSLLSANFSDLKSDIRILEEAGADYLHLDVMDGLFVPNISFGIPVIESIRKLTTMVFDTHLMIEQPERYVDKFAEIGSDIITVHYESTKHLDSVLRKIRKMGKRAGVSINPATPVSLLTEVLDLVDLVLVMSVNPGFGGQSFIPNAIKKISQLKNMRKDYSFEIEVDGGVTLMNAESLIEAGADVLVSGSDIFRAPSIRDRIRAYKDLKR